MNVAAQPIGTAPSRLDAFRPAQRLAAIGVSEILAVTAQAAALKQQGRPVIILGTGEPDFDTPDHIKEAAARAMREGATKYTTLDGTAAMKSSVREKFKRENDLDYALDEITVGAGAKQVIYNAMMATLDPGDEVVIPAPYWVTYADIVLICGGVPVIVPCAEQNGFRLKPEDLERAITPRTRWLMINSPSNPSGAAYAEADYRPILDLVMRHPQVWLMVDDIYEHIVYDGFEFTTPAALAPELKARTLTINGVSKAYAMDRLAPGLWGGTQTPDQGDGGAAEPIDIMPVLDQPGGRDRGPARSTGDCARALCGVPAAPGYRCRRAQCDRGIELLQAAGRFLLLCQLRRRARQAHGRWEEGHNRWRFLRLSAFHAGRGRRTRLRLWSRALLPHFLRHQRG
jgi:hypothetical protein